MTDKIFAAYDFNSDIAANRPATPVTGGGRLYVFLATDTKVISLWNGSVWVNLNSNTKGITDGSSAAAGEIGEIISSTVLSGAAVGLTTSVNADVTSIVLTPGDWEVSGSVFFNVAAATAPSLLAGWVSSTSATTPTAPNGGGETVLSCAFTAASADGFPVGSRQFNVTVNTTVFLTALAVFPSGTVSAYGIIRARRMR